MKKSMFKMIIATAFVVLFWSAGTTFGQTGCSKTTNANIVAAIKAKFEADPEIKEQMRHVNISVKKRIVRLEGWLDGKVLMDKAVALAKSANCVKKVINLLKLFLRGYDNRSDGVLVVAVLVAWTFKLFLEGRFGITPGKWLMDIRTVRSTLRPCGFARALVRDVLLYGIDFPYLLTPIPAVISLVLSDHRQRLGDRVADTVVIRAGSIREVDRSASNHE